MLALDGAERRLEPVPLRLELRAALGDGERVGEDGVVRPEGELALRGVLRKEVEHGADEEALRGGEGDGGCGGDGGVDDGVGGEVRVLGVGGGHEARLLGVVGGGGGG